MDEARLESAPEGFSRVRLDDGRAAVAKVRRHAPPGFFVAEAHGLAVLRDSDTLRIPQVYAFASHGILIEDLGAGRPAREDWQLAGANLARLHAIAADAFGFDADGWCGDSAQDNTRCVDGHRFFAERRLIPQAMRARAAGLLDARDANDVDRIAARLADLIPPAPPVLVHGDLWLANLHACSNGELALIDAAAVHHGWAETDLAMLTLFGEPPPAFFESYENESGKDRSWRERAPIYNLYHLLNHLNLFGGGYLASVRGVLRRYG